MLIEFDRYVVERLIKSYSNDVLSAVHNGAGDKQSAIARAQSLLSDWEYLEKIIARLRLDVAEAQK